MLIDWLLSPTTWIAAIPVALVCALITFEIGMAMSIGSMPRSKSEPLTPEHWRKMRRAWLIVGLSWPIIIAIGIILLVAPDQVRIVVLCAIASIIVIALWRVHRHGKWRHKLKQGHCAGCGYDLRGTIEHREHCPECGLAIPKTAWSLTKSIKPSSNDGQPDEYPLPPS